MNNRKIINQFTKFKYESLQEYNQYIEENIDKSIAKIDEEFKEAQKEYDKNCKDEDDEEFFASHFDDLAYQSQKLSSDILFKHRQSLIFLFYSQFEKELTQICGLIGADSIFKVSDLKGNSIFEQYKVYIKRIEPALYEETSNELLFFDRLRLIRNIITHNDGIIKNTNTHFNKIKDFSLGRLELQSIGINKSDEEVFRIILNQKSFIMKFLKIFTNF